jgi:hypothetical protein
MKALGALLNKMIKVFRNERRLSYVPEAAAIAPVTTTSSYECLSETFINAIINDTDGIILEPQVLKVLRKSMGTLFILDGLDEVSRDLDDRTPGLLRDLLDQPYIIITSQPGMSLAYINHLDLELEIIGFYPDQVEAYINKTAPGQSKGIQSFLREHRLIQGPARIPIQLEALCDSWDDGTANSKGAPTTMTSFYQAMELKLWRGNVARLEKPLGEKPMGVETAGILDSEIMSLVKPEAILLQYLAFAGLYSDVTEFDRERQERLWEHWNELSEHLKPSPTPPLLLDLNKLFFLRMSNTSLDKTEPSYHFSDLTYQEYFAAQYFVEHWKFNQPLLCLALSSGETELINAKDFILEEKYNARYENFWRFVGGFNKDINPAGESPHNGLIERSVMTAF